MYIQPFSMGVDWPEVRCFIFAHTVFFLGGAALLKCTTYEKQEISLSPNMSSMQGIDSVSQNTGDKKVGR